MFRLSHKDKSFYSRAFAIAIPIIIQNGITNFVSLLDNIMVGQMGTVQMSGVSVANQIIMIFNLCIFGATSGAGVFSAQFHGSQDHEGVRYSFRFKVLSCLALTFLCIGVFLGFDAPLISLFLKGEGDPADAAAILLHGTDYMRVMLYGLVPFALSCSYATTLREGGQATVPMVAGSVAVLSNLVLNYALIFGHFGLPELGVKGAAWATVISRFVELAIVAAWTHRNHSKHPFIKGAYRSPYIPGALLRKIAVRATPLLINEVIWSIGIAATNQIYSTRGLDVVNAINISSTINNLASVVTMALGNTVGILMGQMLGSRLPREEILDGNRKLMRLALLASGVFGVLLLSIANGFPMLYNTSDSIRATATQLIFIIALTKPLHSYIYATYFTIRSGGKTWITFAYDGGFLWVVTVPVIFLLSRLTSLPIVPLFALGQLPDLLKCFAGYTMVKKGAWINNLTQNN